MTTLTTPGSDALAAHPPTLAQIRERFPALRRATVFLDNAGGSQLPAEVIGAMRAYLEESYAQLGGEYPESVRAKQAVHRAHEVVSVLMNAGGLGPVILGGSTSQLAYMLANCYAESPQAGRDEVIVAACGHESNVGPWARLAKRGYTVRLWPTHAPSMSLRIDELLPLLSPRTRLVAFPHVSNILGEIVDAPAIVAACRDAGARTVVDGVAFAPHRAIDVAALDCDYYVYSTYKVYGPHMAALFARRDALAELEGPNHYFIDRAEWPRKFELGGVNHEGAAAIGALPQFLRFLAGEAEPAQDHAAPPLARLSVERAFARMTELELPLQQQLIEFLAAHPAVRIIGPAHALPSRIATIAFVVAGQASQAIAAAANQRGLGLRWGHFYSFRLMSELGLHPDEGVVRASLVHYNTPDEVNRLIEFLRQTLPR